MSLHSISLLVQILGRKFHSDRRSRQQCWGQWVTVAANVLSNWPDNFRKELSRLDPQECPDNPFSLRASRIILNLQRALFRSEAEFVTDVISEHAIEHFGLGSRKSQMRKNGAEIDARYVNKTQFAKMCGITRPSVAHFIEAYQISTVRIKRGKREVTLVDVSKGRIPRKRPGKIYDRIEAAAMIGISESVLQQLRTVGIYEVASIPQAWPGFHERDIEQFVRRLTALVTPAISRSTEQIRFDRIMKTNLVSVAAKALLIRMALAGELSLCGSDDGTIHGLLFPKSVLDEVFRREQASSQAFNPQAKDGDFTADLPMTHREVASQLGCSYHAIRKLAERKLLHGTKWRETYLFAPKDVEKFRSEWSSLNALAHRAHHLHTSAYGLMRLSARIKIKVITIPWKRQQRNEAFVSTKDADRLLARASEILRRRNA